VVHGDLEPRNIVRTANGGFLLIDFTESTIHNCPDEDHLDVCIPLSPLLPKFTSVKALELRGPSRIQCPELRLLRKELRR
jgi:hypothetical protein